MFPSWSIVLSSALLFVLSGPAHANEKLRPTSETRLKDAIQKDVARDEFVFVPDSKVAWADYAALRRDFPETRPLSDQEINAWIIDHFAYIARGQLTLGQLRNTEIPTDPNRVKIAQRPPTYGRAAVLDGVDIKGVGHTTENALAEKTDYLWALLHAGENLQSALDKIRVKDHSDGLMSLGEAIAEVTRQNAVQKLFDLRNAARPDEKQLQTVESYFVISLPFDIQKDGEKKIPAALYGRQAHFGRGHMEVHDYYTDDFGSFQASGRGSAVDFGGVVIQDSRLRNNFDAIQGGVVKNPQESKAWSWGHKTADAFRGGDEQAVFRHLSEMLAPIESAWSKLSVAKRRQAFAQAKPDSRFKGAPSFMPRRMERKQLTEIEQGLASRSPAIRSLAAEALKGQSGDKAGELFQKALSDSEASVRMYAAQSLQGYSGPKASELFQKALGDLDRESRLKAANSLQGYSGAKAPELFQIALSDSDPWVRRSAARSLSGYSGEKAPELFQKALSDSESGVRETAATALRGYSGPKGLELFQKALGDESKSVRGAATESLQGYSGAQAEELFQKVLGDSDELVRRNAAEALRGYSGAKVDEFFMKALSDANYWVRAQAAESLERYSGARPLDVFEKALNDEAGAVLHEAGEALKGYAGTRADELFLGILRSTQGAQRGQQTAFFRILLSGDPDQIESALKVIQSPEHSLHKWYESALRVKSLMSTQACVLRALKNTR